MRCGGNGANHELAETGTTRASAGKRQVMRRSTYQRTSALFLGLGCSLFCMVDGTWTAEGLAQGRSMLPEKGTQAIKVADIVRDPFDLPR